MSEPSAEQAETELQQLEDPRLMHHQYDGIREYDNPLPGWWNLFFIATIVFSIGYALYFHIGGLGATPDDRYRAELADWETGYAERERAELASVSEDGLAKKVLDGSVLTRGHDVFLARCASCHGPQGAGQIGPNLTDGYQLHGATRLDVFKTVRSGVERTAMIAWSAQLSPPELLAVTAYVISLRGTNLPGKPPEGAPVGSFQ